MRSYWLDEIYCTDLLASNQTASPFGGFWGLMKGGLQATDNLFASEIIHEWPFSYVSHFTSRAA